MMKKYLEKLQASSLLRALCLLLCLVPSMQTQAATIADNVTDTVAFKEYNQIRLTENTPVTLKIVLKTKGTFVLDFSPKTVGYVQYQLYGENYDLLESNRIFVSSGSASGGPALVFRDYNDGTYYLKMWCEDDHYINNGENITYFARTIPSKDADLEICISLKKGKSIQLGAIISNCKDKKLTWSSSKKSVATVSSSGKVKALKKGIARIKAFNSSGLISTIKVKVTE